MQASPLPARKKGKAASSQNIKVFVRCRPMNSQEKASKSHSVVTVSGPREVVIKERPLDKFAKTFSFDHVFGPDSKQVDVYKAVAKNSVEEVLHGFNCTIFAYGQTGTGKTFTMEGERASNTTSWEEDPMAGIIPRCVNHLFDELRMQKVEFTMRVSFLELYNEELFDLLSAHDDMSKLRLYEDAAKKGSCIIQGLEEVLVRSKTDVYAIMQKGSTKRQTAATLMNAHSSRSHTVFTVTLHMKENTMDGDELLKTGKLHLVDLAGSENIGRSGAVDKRAREAGNINMSLLTLGRVIKALVEKAPHIPYRESKLTRLLQDALGGRTKTSVIATVSPASVNQEETLSTLDYAYRAKNIQNKPEVNQKLNKKELIGEYSQEIERLRRDLMAMREKSGVYLANENYQEMCATMETQAQEITEKIGHIRTLEAEVEKRMELFAVVNQKLEATTHTLATTQDKLATTRTTLGATQGLLHATAQEREEQKFLVSAHARTEERLHSEGHSLITAATDTTADVAKLHDKLDRKRNVESVNAEVTQDFRGSYTASQDAFRRDLVSTLTAHTTTLSTTTTQHCERVRGCLRAVTDSSRTLTTLGQQQANLTTQTINLVNTMVEAMVRGVEEARVEGRRDAATLGHTLATLLASGRDTLDHLGANISASTTTLATHHSQVKQKLAQMEGSCGALELHVDSYTTQLLEEVEARHMATLRHSDQAAAVCVARQADTRTHVQDMDVRIETLMATLSSMKDEMAGFATSTHTQDTTLHQGLSLLQEEAVQGVATVQELARQGRQGAAALIDGVRALTEEMREQVDGRVDELEVSLRQGGQRRCEVLSGLEHSVGGAQQALDTATATQDSRAHSIEDTATQHNTAVQEHLQAGQSSLSVGLSEQSRRLEGEAGVLEGATGGLAGGVEGVEGGLKEWCGELDNKLETQANRVITLLTEDLLQDKPTGQTPVRREYPFPPHLSATSPHERLLRRYRASTSSPLYHSRIPLPSLADDAEDDLGDSTLSASSDSPLLAAEDTLTEDDAITADSRSRSGSVSSLKDQGSGQFAVPRPPLQREDSGIPLSRSSSSSSITDGKENQRTTRQTNSNSKTRELKPLSVYKSASLEKLPSAATATTTTTTTTATEGRSRRILGSQN